MNLLLWLSYISATGHPVTFPPFFTTSRQWSEGITQTIKPLKFSTRRETPKGSIVTNWKIK